MCSPIQCHHVAFAAFHSCLALTAQPCGGSIHTDTVQSERGIHLAAYHHLYQRTEISERQRCRRRAGSDGDFHHLVKPVEFVCLDPRQLNGDILASGNIGIRVSQQIQGIHCTITIVIGIHIGDLCRRPQRRTRCARLVVDTQQIPVMPARGHPIYIHFGIPPALYAGAQCNLSMLFLAACRR